MMAHLRERECGRVENGFETRNVSRRPIFRHRIGPISVRSWPVFSGKSLMSREAEYHKADNIFRPVALQRLTRCGVSHAGSRPTTPMTRTEERRGGKGGVSTGRCRWWPDH